MVRNHIYAPLWKKGAYYFAPVCRSVWRPSDVRLIYLDVFAGKLQNVEQCTWMTLESKCSLMIFSSHGQRLRSNCCSLYKCRPLVFLKLLYLKVAKLGTVDAQREVMFPSDFLVTLSRSNCWSFRKCCLLN